MQSERTPSAASLLAEALDLARAAGFHIREEDLDGAGGGHCRFGGKKWLLLDVAQTSQEQLADVADALRSEGVAGSPGTSAALASLLVVSKAA
ncbi:MAG TPA: hypothetical protein PKC18_12890 [Lacipirellulaceae bacterium]|nr:hypothetical protein [Lacipirellulaceae bacterium]